MASLRRLPTFPARFLALIRQDQQVGLARHDGLLVAAGADLERGGRWTVTVNTEWLRLLRAFKAVSARLLFEWPRRRVSTAAWAEPTRAL